MAEKNKPFVLRNALVNWNCKLWTPESLKQCLGDKQFKIRVGDKVKVAERNTKDLNKYCKECEIVWETDCSSQSTSIEEFIKLVERNHDTHWYYMDYKYMFEHFNQHPQLIKSIEWSQFVDLPSARDGSDSTFWLGSSGAYTACHQDTYGCNLVAQLYGSKQWVLFPPSDTQHLYPTRVPYEESSVFSEVNVLHPNHKRHPLFKHSSPHCVTLQSGDALFVPKHWWHFVYCVSPLCVTVNTWIPLASDREDRVREALVKLLAHKLLSNGGTSESSDPHWLNPTEAGVEDVASLLQYVSQSVSSVCGGDVEGEVEAVTVRPPSPDTTVEPVGASQFTHYLQEMNTLHPQGDSAGDTSVGTDQPEGGSTASAPAAESLMRTVAKCVLHPRTIDVITQQLITQHRHHSTSSQLS